MKKIPLLVISACLLCASTAYANIKTTEICPQASTITYNIQSQEYTAPLGWVSGYVFGTPTLSQTTFGDAVIKTDRTDGVECIYQSPGGVFDLIKPGFSPAKPVGPKWVRLNNYWTGCGSSDQAECPFILSHT